MGVVSMNHHVAVPTLRQCLDRLEKRDHFSDLYIQTVRSDERAVNQRCQTVFAFARKTDVNSPCHGLAER
jgi:hypothetical protein